MPSFADMAELVYALVSEANEPSSCEFESHCLHQDPRSLGSFLFIFFAIISLFN